MSLTEFDSLSRKRISRIITIREKQLERENELREQQMKEAERKARAKTKQKGSQRIKD